VSALIGRACAADELLARLGWVKRDFAEALNIGAADDYLRGGLERRVGSVTSCDPGRLFARQAGAQCDEDRLPFADSSFDLVTSVGTLDSVNDLPGALALIRRVLRPDGLFLGACAGAGSLPRLRSAMFAADSAEGAAASPRIHPQIDIRAAGDLLQRAGFSLPVVDGDRITVRFSGLPALVSDLRSMAATNILSARSEVPITRRGLAAAIADFGENSDPDGKTPERFEILYLIGWSPSPDQPRPAQRGSATQSLASALRPPPER
jgi:SAM-dependent methyltransferase